MTLIIEKSWQKVLKDEISKPYIQELTKFLTDEKKQGQGVFPPEHLIFNAFLKTPYEKVKVVIMGQDPYHNVGQAHGLCFSVAKGVRTPPSLQNIYKELKADLGINPPNHGCLEKWSDQGILLLNATLTVRAHSPKSHYGKGWEQFTDQIIEKLCEREDPIVFILWGRSAKEKCSRILDQKKHRHAVLSGAHPSPFSAHLFFGCRHFSKTNEFLKKWGKTPIDWSLDQM